MELETHLRKFRHLTWQNSDENVALPLPVSDFDTVFGLLPENIKPSPRPIPKDAQFPSHDNLSTGANCVCGDLIARVIANARLDDDDHASKFCLARLSATVSEFLAEPPPCSVCNFIQHHISTELAMDKDKEKYLNEKLELSLSFDRPRHFRYPTITVSAGGHELKDLSLVPTLYDTSEDIAHLPLSTTVVPSNSMDVDVLETLRSWLRQCEDHSGCVRPKAKRSPRRLVDVGTERIPELHLRTCDGNEGDFVALSYCWGHYKGPKLTQTCIEAFHEGLDETILPQTYKDAIWVTRKLGIRYLWIDALCILQDNEEDWRAESMKMDQVYGNARLTIAAFRASSDMEGFLGDRDSQPIWAFCGTISYIDEKYPVYMVDEDEMRKFKFYIHEPQGPLGKQPLASRGWAIQERLMSRRIVYFTSNRMIWQCTRGITTEEGLICDPQLQLAWIKDNTAHSYWCDVVKQYSSCKLSHPSDRLPALAGLEHAIRGLRTDDDSFCSVTGSTTSSTLFSG
ncbi:hypothetical protein M409DRAFT_16258 [Zasmidium cellare ATCC 36951]|uniref:Heterokaryon incompatibility domain-containing protein n=1 Tax=Zasmidium cellare ATCC 36951 TaxID=1080233 RepID=A0A6A6D3M9_ZASCE|nr:uncharacterized protein M409DRAFT_16258 [Zasmidium cellare ATCC 36951]KAF2173987.1 hypothetical protein M409DRAFT_16258 [Zasmidium cellare ATCC 36951]